MSGVRTRTNPDENGGGPGGAPKEATPQEVLGRWEEAAASSRFWQNEAKFPKDSNCRLRGASA